MIRRIVVTLAYTFSSTKHYTRLHTLRVRGVPRGATVTATCRKGCSRKKYVKTNAHGTVSLAKLIRKRLRAGTEIVVTVTLPGWQPMTKTLKIRARHAPLVTTR